MKSKVQMIGLFVAVSMSLLTLFLVLQPASPAKAGSCGSYLYGNTCSSFRGVFAGTIPGKGDEYKWSQGFMYNYAFGKWWNQSYSTYTCYGNGCWPVYPDCQVTCSP